MTDSRGKCDTQKEEERQLHGVEMHALDELRELIKTHELIHKKRAETNHHLPTNRVVTPAHNALVKEDVKEGMLIAESFKAIKDEKATTRAKLASRLDKAEQTCESECATFRKQIEGLYGIARLLSIQLDNAELDGDRYK
jgi:hypothetical protein